MCKVLNTKASFKVGASVIVLCLQSENKVTEFLNWIEGSTFFVFLVQAREKVYTDWLLSSTSTAGCWNPASSWSPLHGQRWHLWPLCQGLRPPWQEEEVWHKGSQENAQSCLQWELYLQGKLKHPVVTFSLLLIKTTCTSSCLMCWRVLLIVNRSSCLSLFLFFSFTNISGQQWQKAADILKVSDRENVLENQIKGEGHLWCTLPADTAL